jgi:hypothetical protein
MREEEADVHHPEKEDAHGRDNSTEISRLGHSKKKKDDNGECQEC